MAHIARTLTERVVTSGCDGVEGWAIRVSAIIEVKRNVAAANLDTLAVAVETDHGPLAMEVEQMGRDDGGRFGRVQGIDSYDIFPECVANQMRAATVQNYVSEVPSTPEEAAEYQKEVRALPTRRPRAVPCSPQMRCAFAAANVHAGGVPHAPS